jgi:hypothetical protein
MIAVSHPDIRPETGMEVAKYSQRSVDLLNLEEKTFETRPFVEVIKEDRYPALQLLTSEIADGYLRDWFTTSAGSSGKNLVLTFNNLINQTGMVNIIGEVLIRLENAWEQPVDIEFTAHVDVRSNNVRINLLQCRSLRVPTLAGTKVRMPEELPRKHILFRSNRAINAGMIDDIRYIIYINPKTYAEVAIDAKKSLGRVIGKLNDELRYKEGKVMSMGPGRWGSNNIELGVNVGYADIDATAVLVELAREEAGHVPEVSYGTHFFQDLVESDILYIPVYPDDTATDFNTEFFANSPNILKDLLPELRDFEDTVRVIDVSMATGGALARVIANPETRNAICFLDMNRIADTT